MWEREVSSLPEEFGHTREYLNATCAIPLHAFPGVNCLTALPPCLPLVGPLPFGLCPAAQGQYQAATLWGRAPKGPSAAPLRGVQHHTHVGRRLRPGTRVAVRGHRPTPAGMGTASPLIGVLTQMQGFTTMLNELTLPLLSVPTLSLHAPHPLSSSRLPRQLHQSGKPSPARPATHVVRTCSCQQ